jgi:predicted homoserine dehydrogenase-like protein
LSIADAVAAGSCAVVADGGEVAAAEQLDVLIESTGSPGAAARHALAAFEAGTHVVNVTVEVDALVGPLLAARARSAGVVYSLASGDQPALICELVDWARVSGFEVVCAGKGTKYLPEYHASTPDTVWDSYGIGRDHAEAHGLNAQMFNSFLDGTKSAIEMAAVANATGLRPREGGLGFPAAGEHELASVCVPIESGGMLEFPGAVEVVSSLRRDGGEVERDLRWGVYVVFEAPSEYVTERFREYGLVTDESGRYSALWRPYHLIGLELATSVARAALQGASTGTPQQFIADVVAVAKRDLEAGEVLDGEGGHRVWGLLRPATRSVEAAALPIALAHGVKLRQPVSAGTVLGRDDVELDPADPLVALRAELEASSR